MNLASEWRLTFDPAGATERVLVEFGQEISQELDLQLRRACEVVPIIEAAPFLNPSEENNLVTFSVSVNAYHDLDKNSRAAAMDALIDQATLSKKPLRIEVRGLETAMYWQFADCYITTFRAAYVIDLDAPCHIRRYDVQATGLAKTTL